MNADVFMNDRFVEFRKALLKDGTTFAADTLKLRVEFKRPSKRMVLFERAKDVLYNSTVRLLSVKSHSTGSDNIVLLNVLLFALRTKIA